MPVAESRHRGVMCIEAAAAINRQRRHARENSRQCHGIADHAAREGEAAWRSAMILRAAASWLAKAKCVIMKPMYVSAKRGEACAEIGGAYLSAPARLRRWQRNDTPCGAAMKCSSLCALACCVTWYLGAIIAARQAAEIAIKRWPSSARRAVVSVSLWHERA